MIYDAGNFREGTAVVGSTTSAHNFEMSPASNRNNGPPPTDTGGVEAGLGVALTANTYGGRNAPLVQGYDVTFANMSAVSGTYYSSAYAAYLGVPYVAPATTNDGIIISAPGVINPFQLNAAPWPGDPEGSSSQGGAIYGIVEYFGNSGNSYTVSLTQLLIPKTYTVGISLLFGGASSGIVYFYADSVGHGSVLIGSMDYSGTASPSASFSWDSVSAFGASCLFTLRAVATATFDYSGATWKVFDASGTPISTGSGLPVSVPDWSAAYNPGVDASGFSFDSPLGGNLIAVIGLS